MRVRARVSLPSPLPFTLAGVPRSLRTVDARARRRNLVKRRPPSLGSARARLLWMHLAALGGAALPGGEGRATGRPAAASGARASRLQSHLLSRTAGGSIVSVTMVTHNGLPRMAHSGAARAGVDNLAKSLAIEHSSMWQGPSS